VLEAGFLVLLAVVVGIADLSPALIVLVMAIAWLLVALIEYFAWRQTVAAPMRYGVAVEEGPAPAVVHEEAVEEVPPAPPPVAPPPPAAEEETMIEPTPPGAGSTEETITQADERVAARRTSFVDQERRTRHRLDPLQPRPRRRWIFFGPYERPEAPAESSREEER
jgi:hypothetical protein